MKDSRVREIHLLGDHAFAGGDITLATPLANVEVPFIWLAWFAWIISSR